MERSVGLPGFRDFILILGNANFRSVFGEPSGEIFTRTKFYSQIESFGKCERLDWALEPILILYYRAYERAPEKLSF